MSLFPVKTLPDLYRPLFYLCRSVLKEVTAPLKRSARAQPAATGGHLQIPKAPQGLHRLDLGITN